jgi:TetR/AcrR family transcriptional repressor of nem operon
MPVSKGTKERLVTAAMDLIWKSSYSSVSVDDICKEANVKKGSFYHFFPSKIDLASAAMEEAFESFRPMLDEVFSPVNTSVERFEKYAEMGYLKQKEIEKQYSMVCGCPFISLGSEMAPQNEVIREKTDEIIARHKKYYETTLRDMAAEGVIDKDTNIQSVSDQVYAFVMGQLVMARIQNSLEPLEFGLTEGLFRIIGVKSDMRNAT